MSDLDYLRAGYVYLWQVAPWFALARDDRPCVCHEGERGVMIRLARITPEGVTDGDVGVGHRDGEPVERAR